MATTKKLMGTTAVGGALAIEDVFSTYLYTGNDTARSISNGIDLAGEGGLVWIKSRGGLTHYLYDTERGIYKDLNTAGTAAEGYGITGLTSFNSDGFSIGTLDNINNSFFAPPANTFASWTFRKAPRFFDVVTYTGDGATARTIGHNLGVDPGCILLFCSSTAQNRYVYHRGVDATAPEDYHLILNATDARTDSAVAWNDTAPTSTEFTVRSTYGNRSGRTYVAYLFAHDPLGESGDGSDGLIACGSYTGNGSSDGPEIDLGWEPQWYLFKKASGSGSWFIYDNMRGLGAQNSNKPYLWANYEYGEQDSDRFYITPTGIKISNSNDSWNEAGADFIYIAIRRGPMRQPESGTEVFAVDESTGSTTTPISSGFPVDQILFGETASSPFHFFSFDRMRGGKYSLTTSKTDAEVDRTTVGVDFDSNTSVTQKFFGGANLISWMWRRAPGFFDVVAYTGDGTSSNTISHNLGVAPEMIIIKRRSAAANWYVDHSGLGATNYILLNSTAAQTTPKITGNYTENAFDLLNTSALINGASDTYIAYLFATLPGVSKVGSYTGNGTSQTINCGFTSGARFILIKRTDSTGDWYVWDTARGIVAANDPHLSLNNTAAEVTTDDSVDPDNSGFIVNQVAATNINVSSANYIFYAIA